jgi:hypothetical protein
MNPFLSNFHDGSANVTSAESCADPPITKYPEYLKRSASFMTSLRRMPIFDGHNDVLLRLYRRGGTNAARAFLEGGDKGAGSSHGA